MKINLHNVFLDPILYIAAKLGRRDWAFKIYSNTRSLRYYRIEIGEESCPERIMLSLMRREVDGWKLHEGLGTYGHFWNITTVDRSQHIIEASSQEEIVQSWIDEYQIYSHEITNTYTDRMKYTPVYTPEEKILYRGKIASEKFNF